MGLNQKTINRYFNLFRQLIYDNQQADLENFFGVIECDESYFGSKRLMGLSMPQKRYGVLGNNLFFLVYMREGGRVYTELIPSAHAIHLRNVIIGKVSIESIAVIKGWMGYNGLVDLGFDKHFRTDKSKSFSHNGVHINGIENFWNFTKRRLAKFNGVKNFIIHLKECEWRWDKNEQEMEQELWKSLLKSWTARCPRF